MQKSFSRIIIAFLLVFTSAISLGQNYKTELRILDLTEENLIAGLHFTGIPKTQFSQMVDKANSLKLYSVKTEFYDDKNVGFISLRSNSNVTISDFQGFLKQLEISLLNYNGKTISVQEIEANYKPLNKTEVINKQRN